MRRFHAPRVSSARELERNRLIHASLKHVHETCRTFVLACGGAIHIHATGMRIRVMGAAGGEVTGSAYLVEANGARVLVDCGLFQGGKDAEEKNRSPLVEPGAIDAILLTHAHLDHTGRVPLLIKGGYNRPIYATAPTVDLADIVL